MSGDVIRQGKSKDPLPNIKLLDSYNFVSKPLSALPKFVGAEELAKGDFPHLFNKPKDQTIVVQLLP